MKKYLLLLLPLLAACAGAPEVEIEKKIEYKCGEQIISADFLDDDSMIARVDGINYVLVRVAAADGRRYENTATGMTFMQNGNGTYLSSAFFTSKARCTQSKLLPVPYRKRLPYSCWKSR